MSQESFWLSIPLVIVLLGLRYSQQQKKNNLSPSFRQLSRALGIFIATVLIVIAPLKVIYPFSQGNWAVNVEQMRETRSRGDFKPSLLTAEGYRLASKGEPISTIVNNLPWYTSSLKSFYGYFGYMTVSLPNWIYLTALIITMLNIALTIGVAGFKWPLLNRETKALIMVVPVAILLSIAASIYNSWTYDFQPQGRYLFSSLVAFAILLAGTIHIESKWSVLFRHASWFAAYLLCVYVLVNFAI